MKKMIILCLIKNDKFYIRNVQKLPWQSNQILFKP